MERSRGSAADRTIYVIMYTDSGKDHNEEDQVTTMISNYSSRHVTKVHDDNHLHKQSTKE